MSLKKLFPTLATVLTIVLLLTLKTHALDPIQKNIIDNLSRAGIVYLGETHSREEDHRAQLKIITALYSKNPRLAIGFEMFQNPYQSYLDDYIAGTIDERQLREKTEYDDRWGYDWELYAPILRFARSKKIPLIALNTPTEITRQVAQKGLESLTEDQLGYIPPKDEIKTDNEAYKRMMLEVFQQHAGGNSRGFDRFFLAQVLWDETMADRIVRFYRKNPDRQIIVLAGEGHIIYGYGIPSRVTRRLGEDVKTLSVLLSYDGSPTGSPLPADFLWPGS